MNWKESCNDAKNLLEGTALMLLDKGCNELFHIADNLGPLSEEAEKCGESSVACALYAASYRLAGTAKDLAYVSGLVMTMISKYQGKVITVNENDLKFRFSSSANHYIPMLEKLADYQMALRDFAKALHRDAHNELMHLKSELIMIIEHPFSSSNMKFAHSLSYQRELIEEISERFYHYGMMMEQHHALKIDATIIDGMVH